MPALVGTVVVVAAGEGRGVVILAVNKNISGNKSSSDNIVYLQSQ